MTTDGCFLAERPLPDANGPRRKSGLRIDPSCKIGRKNKCNAEEQLPSRSREVVNSDKGEDKAGDWLYQVKIRFNTMRVDSGEWLTNSQSCFLT